MNYHRRFFDCRNWDSVVGVVNCVMAAVPGIFMLFSVGIKIIVLTIFLRHARMGAEA